MFLREEYAKGKWCPPSFNKVADNGHGIAISDPDHCCGSMCMAWRWEDEFIPRETRSDDTGGRERTDSNPMGAKPEGEGWKWDDEDCEWYRLHPERRKGYCGLVGKPEVA